MIKRYIGAFSQGEISADNRELYEKILNDSFKNEEAKLAAKVNLELYTRFPPGKPYDRLVGHIGQVYTGTRKEGYEKIFQVNFGSFVIDGSPLEEVLIKQDVWRDLENGRRIKGDLYEQRVISPQDQPSFTEIEKYFTVTMNKKSYSFDVVKTEGLRYVIIQYVNFNQELIDINAEEIIFSPYTDKKSRKRRLRRKEQKLRNIPEY